MDDRKHLTSREIEKLIAATMGRGTKRVTVACSCSCFATGLRVSEALSLNLSQIDLEGRTLHVSRLKSGLSTNHPLRADECRAIRAWLTVREKMKPETKTLFVSARRGALSRKTAWLAIRQYGEAAELEIAAHPHMLRHACGFALADQCSDTRLIQDYLDTETYSTLSG